MPTPPLRFLCTVLLLTTVFIFSAALPAAAELNDLFGKKEMDEKERTDTIERIDSIQEKLKLLQEKLRVLERRKSYREAAKRAEEMGTADMPNVQINWLAVDETTTNPGEAGVYTYLFFNGKVEDTAAIGALEDFILTIETLPANNIPTGSANRFVLPVEKPQSSIGLGRQPYNFKLNDAYLRRLGLHGEMPQGPVLVSMKEAIDPYGTDTAPAYLAVSFGRQAPERTLELAEIWHRHVNTSAIDALNPVSDLFWEVIDGAGPTTVARAGQKVLVQLPQP